jgi:hypothetical protein
VVELPKRVFAGRMLHRFKELYVEKGWWMLSGQQRQFEESSEAWVCTSITSINERTQERYTFGKKTHQVLKSWRKSLPIIWYTCYFCLKLGKYRKNTTLCPPQLRDARKSELNDWVPRIICLTEALRPSSRWVARSKHRSWLYNLLTTRTRNFIWHTVNGP